jgi:ribosome recycling factor
VTLLDARTIGVQPWEKKMIATVEKAIRESDLGLNPSTQGDVIRVPTPALTEERRKEMVKLVKNEAEDAKIAIRNIRRDANEGLKKLLKEMNQDLNAAKVKIEAYLLQLYYKHGLTLLKILITTEIFLAIILSQL